MAVKSCKQCGELKPIEQFRKYYGGRKGHYNTCKTCEKINARYKYLRAKGEENRSDAESKEFEKIYTLYKVQIAAGLRPPREDAGRKTTLADNLDGMIAKYNVKPSTPTEQHEVPYELAVWLTCELTEEPDYYLDEVYEELKKKYRPVKRIDTMTMQPIYDNTYKSTLDKILERFYEYDDEYWG